MDILCAGLTDVGRKRSSNQDSIFLDPALHLYIVADGMGGHQGGDIASQMAVKCLPEFIRPQPDADPKIILRDGIIYSNQSILNHARQNPQLQGMGTTMVSMYFKFSTLFLANVGDSRAYLINRGLIYQLTRDHSLIQEKINMGMYSREDAFKDKKKNVLVRAVGFEENVEVDIFSYKISKNDMFIICSDGLHGKVSERDILYIVTKNIPSPATATAEHLKKTAKELIDQANANGGQDNSSVIFSLVH